MAYPTVPATLTLFRPMLFALRIRTSFMQAARMFTRPPMEGVPGFLQTAAHSSMGLTWLALVSHGQAAIHSSRQPVMDLPESHRCFKFSGQQMGDNRGSTLREVCRTVIPPILSSIPRTAQMRILPIPDMVPLTFLDQQMPD